MRSFRKFLFYNLFLSMVFIQFINISLGADPLSDLRILQSQGFVVSKTTRIVGPFKGCEAGQTYRLLNGNDFECEPVQEATNPELKTLKNPKTGEVRFVINDVEYDGEIDTHQE